MFTAKVLDVKESLEELNKLLRKAPAHIRSRLQMLLMIKADKHHSKRALATALGTHPTTVQNWKRAYAEGGIEHLVQDKRGGNNAVVIDAKTSEAIGLKLCNAKEAPTSFKALQQWVDEHYIPGVNYQTLYQHVKQKFGAKLKIARKSHVYKDEQAAAAFKKTLLNR